MIVTDQMGREILLSKVPERIVSLVPSQTEYLYDLGLEEQIVGQTLYCIHPEEAFRKSYKIGGTKKLNLIKIRALNPDLIIANKEENDQKQIEELALEFPVWISDIKTLKDALDMMQKLGDILNKKAESAAIVNDISNQFKILQKQKITKTALYLIWQKPWMAAGPQTFISEMLHFAGFNNVVTETETRYPNLFFGDMENYKPDCIFLSTEPFPFKESHVAELQAVFPNSIVKLVDGEIFSWYGSRLKKCADYFKTLV